METISSLWVWALSLKGLVYDTFICSSKMTTNVNGRLESMNCDNVTC